MKKRNLLLIVSFIFAINLTSFSQENAVKNKNERSHKGDILYQYFTNSQYAIDNGKYKEAIDLLMDLNKLVPGDANVLYNIGQAYIDYPIYPDEKAKAIPYLEKCLNGVSLYHEGGFNDTTAPLHAFYSLAEAYIAANRVEDAIEVNKKFHNYVEEWWGPAFYSDLKKEDLIDEAEKQKEVCNNALKFMANPLNVKIKNIGIPISSKYHDYNAFISPDNKTIMYTSKNIVDTTNNITSKEIGDTLIIPNLILLKKDGCQELLCLKIS